MDGSKNALIIEDEPMLRDLYQKALRGAGYIVEVAGNWAQAREKLVHFKPSYVLLDVMLPGETGLEVLQFLRNDASFNCTQARILVLTNLAQHSVADNAMDHGADGYIIKADILPADLPEILESTND